MIPLVKIRAVGNKRYISVLIRKILNRVINQNNHLAFSRQKKPQPKVAMTSMESIGSSLRKKVPGVRSPEVAPQRWLLSYHAYGC
jgi:DNA helicase HerA-like ATPase